MLINKDELRRVAQGLLYNRLKNSGIDAKLILSDDTVGEIIEAMETQFDAEVGLAIESYIQEFKEKIPACPVCGSESVKWITNYEQSCMVLGLDPDQPIDSEDLERAINSACVEEGGVWICTIHTDKDGCGATSGWKPDNSVKEWFTKKK